MEIAKIRVHPAIGIARLGNSPEHFFTGPELPGVWHDGPFKDEQGRVQRQAVRFRLYGYDARDELIGEVTGREASIRWTVHLANHKAAWKQFDGLNVRAPLRNAEVADRHSLIIDPGPRSLTGPDQAARFDGGTFCGKPVPLGEARTDAHGRLLVLGGFGHSESVPAGRPLVTYANNDGWHDDVSDGPVTAEVTMHGQRVATLPSWVICAPPDFAPSITSPVTLYDTLLQVAIDRGLASPVAVPSFTRDVHPILARAVAIGWVSKMAAPNHHTLAFAFGPGATVEMKKLIFKRLRDPALSPDQEGAGDMPMVWSDSYPGGFSLTLTPTQYDIMRKWSDGHFVDDWKGHPARHASHVTPEGLDRAALEACIGGAFFPGIEASWLLRDHYEFVEAFRLSHAGRRAGDVTKQMAVPWQADFNECAQEGDYAWWPSQRPDDVFPEGTRTQVPWTRDHVVTDADMVRHWHKLGFVVKKGDRYVESERG